MKFCFIYLIYSLLILKLASADTDFTITVDSGSEECFYQSAKEGEFLEIEYQVIDGENNDLHIDFRLHAPSSRVIESGLRKSDGNHRFKVQETGEYKLCFDNLFSSSTKVVFFEVFTDASDGESDDNNDDWIEDGILATGAIPEEQYEITVQEIQDSINRVRTSLTKVKHFQEQLRTTEARDRNIQENNFTHVNNWSLIQLIVMVVVGLIQVITVRSLFDEKSRMHRLWKKS